MPFLGVAERLRARLGRLAGRRRRHAVGAVPQPDRQRLEPRLARDGRLGLPLLLEREIKIFEPREIERRAQLGRQLGRQLPLPLDLAEDERLPLHDLVPGLLRVDDRADRDLVELARLLLAVARDEGDGGAAVGQLEHGVRRGQGNLRMTVREPFRKVHESPTPCGSKFVRLCNEGRAGEAQSTTSRPGGHRVSGHRVSRSPFRRGAARRVPGRGDSAYPASSPATAAPPRARPATAPPRPRAARPRRRCRRSRARQTAG